MTLKQLSRCSVLRCRLLRAEELLLSLREAVRPKAPVIDGMPHVPGIKDKIGNLAAEIADLSKRIDSLKVELRQEELVLSGYIEAIDDERLRMIFRLKFLRDLTWEQTADVLGDNYTEESVKRLIYRYLAVCDP